MKKLETTVILLFVACFLSCCCHEIYLHHRRHHLQGGSMTFDEAVQLANDREKFGFHKGYKAGWSDALCGKGYACQAGQN